MLHGTHDKPSKWEGRSRLDMCGMHKQNKHEVVQNRTKANKNVFPSTATGPRS